MQTRLCSVVSVLQYVGYKVSLGVLCRAVIGNVSKLLMPLPLITGGLGLGGLGLGLGGLGGIGGLYGSST